MTIDPSLSPPALSVSGVTVRALVRLAADETAFAYSRISPDGRHLAYTREPVPLKRIPVRHVRVIDVETGEPVFEEEGLDAYWSPDGAQLIYLSQIDPWAPHVAILDWRSREIARDVAPVNLGDYFSWGQRHDGDDVIATIRGNYFSVNNGRAKLPASRMSPCKELDGVGERPLLSKDAARATVFSKGEIAVRPIDGCDGIIMTGVQGAKADFSYGGEQIAFHRPKPGRSEFQITIVDLERMSAADIDIPGSAYYPSWTASGQLSFRYESENWHGFVLASGIESLPRYPLEAATSLTAERTIRWTDVFTSLGLMDDSEWRVVIMWAAWNPHSEPALLAAEEAQRVWRDRGAAIGVYESAVPGSRVAEVRQRMTLQLPTLDVRERGWPHTWANAQVPLALIFHGDQLVSRLLGAQSAAELLAAVERARVVALVRGHEPHLTDYVSRALQRARQLEVP